MFYLKEYNIYNGLFFWFTNILFNILEFNPLYYKKKPCVKVSYDIILL